MKRLDYNIISFCLFLIISIGSYSCKKDAGLSSSPYSSGIKPLVSFLNLDPYPSSGTEGSEVTFYVDGLQGKDTSEFSFYINQVKATVVSVEDSAITVIVPHSASSGAGSVMINGQNYFGPVFDVEGNVSIDATFTAGSGTGISNYNSYSIRDILSLSDGSYLLVGNFKDYNGTATTSSPVNGMVNITKDGVKKTNIATLGANGGTFNTVVSTGSGFLIGGLFSSFDSTTSKITNITKLLSNGRLDTTQVELINEDPTNHPENDSAWVPTFNAELSDGYSGEVKRIFADGSGGYIAIGNFAIYDSFYYYRSTVDQFVSDRFNINQIVRFRNSDGGLDTSYNINPTTQLTYSATNGVINDAIQLSDKSIIIAGSFTSFDGISQGRIAKLTSTGQPDVSFNNGGTGADDAITRITYNANTHRIMLTGYFRNYNGVSAPGVVMLKEDGTVDNSFTLGDLTGGIATFAAQLNDGKVLVSGTFTNYNGIYRQGMVILNADGSYADGYNNMGAFVGTIYKMVETTTTLGTRALLLVGSFNLVDNTSVGNIVRLEVL